MACFEFLKVPTMQKYGNSLKSNLKGCKDDLIVLRIFCAPTVRYCLDLALSHHRRHLGQRFKIYEGLPSVHKQAAFLEQITAPVSCFGFIADNVR